MVKEFYFLCARGTHGGPEALHQIVDKINTVTKNKAYITYFQKDFVKEEKFKSFNVNYLHIKDVPDVDSVVLCATETNTYFFRRFKNTKKVMVWLSLYHYLRNIKESEYTFIERCKYLYSLNKYPWPAYPLYYLRDLLQNKKHFRFDMQDVIHTYNCEYVAEYLRNNGVKENEMLFLDGPIRTEYFQEMHAEEKKHIVAYNPAKGAEQYAPAVIEEMKKLDSTIEFIAISGLTVQQVKDALLKAKVYLDFGFFPGPEKLVKEAALCGCNIITSDRGAAKNDVDILIPKEFKFDMEKDDYKDIACLAYDMLKNYQNYIEMFDGYRNKIKTLSDNFEQVIENFTQMFD